MKRILFSTLAAATLLTAAPALAAEKAEPRPQPCSCCSDGSDHATEHPMREGNKAAEKAKAQKQAPEVDPFTANGEFGG